MAGVDTKAALVRALEELQRQRAEIEALRRDTAGPIAVVGMACRFPGGSCTPDAYWDLLAAGRDAVGEIPADRWNGRAYYDPDPATPGRMATMSGAFVDDVDQFDAGFFGIAPREAQSMDPQQRLLLEVAWEALEDAGISPTSLYGTAAGVFVGITCFDHAIRLSRSIDNFNAHAGTGSALNMAPGRLSYVLGLTGPSLAVDTACSSSLVALHLACQSLRSRECHVALVGGVHLVLSPDVMVSFSQARMLAPDGRCKTFDAAADGYSRGEGCGVVVLKRLADAQADGDSILGIIRGTAVNQDGPSGGLTVPNGAAQEMVIRRALAAAGIAPAGVSYVETHGTGTPLGDPIEIEALARVYGDGRTASEPLLVGAVKTNIGHLEPAAGMAGLIKLLLAFRHERLPRHLHFRTPNPRLDWNRLPVRVVADSTPWPRSEHPRVAGLSAFGFSGTNAHVIVEEPPASVADTAAAPPLVLLALSAKTEPALVDLARRYAAHLASADHADLAAIACTAGLGRAHFDHRLAIVAADSGEVRAALAAFVDGQPFPSLTHGRVAEVAYRRDPRSTATALQQAEAARAADPSSRDALARIAALYVNGAEIDWASLFPAGTRRHARLPFYPFQRQRHWLDIETSQRAHGGLPIAEYAIEWEKLPADGPPDRSTPRRLVVVPPSPLATSLAAALAASGSPATTSSVEAVTTADATDVIYLGGMQESPERTDAACVGLVAMAQALRSGARAVRLWVVTQGAAPVGDRVAATAVAQAPVAAFARVLGLEHPELVARSIDLDPDDPAPAATIADEVRRAAADDHIAIRGADRYAPRVQRATARGEGRLSISADATYLVTGGLGAIGLKIGRWLAERGARHLCLAGRSGATTARQRLAIDLMRERGVDVDVARVDVADRAAVTTLVRDLAARDAALRGIVHAAGVEGYVAFDALTPEVVASVLRPKVLGGWALHEAAEGIPLDFFICFSSIASAWGSRGQAHYAAANAALDALAHLRRRRGLPGVAINWGPWAEGGMNSAETDALLRRAGIRPLAADAALAALEHAATGERAQVIVADIDWRLFTGSYEARGRRPLLERVRSQDPVAAAGASPISSRLLSADPRDRERVAMEIVQAETAQVLGTATRDVDPGRGLFDMGMDSLMALDLRTRLEALAGRPLPATLIFDYPTVRAITTLLLDGAASTPPSRPARVPQASAPAPPAGATPDLESLSDEEAEALLLSRLDSLETGS